MNDPEVVRRGKGLGDLTGDVEGICKAWGLRLGSRGVSGMEPLAVSPEPDIKSASVRPSTSSMTSA